MLMDKTHMPRREAAADDALSVAREFGGPLLVDFDETLYLRNSTEDFIDTAVPAPLALLILRVLDALKPWRWTGGAATRDVWRVWAIMWLFPWTRLRWRKRARDLGQQFRNEALAATLATRSQSFTIVTLGFDNIVAPLIETMELGACRVVACKLSSTTDRRRGKLAVVERALGAAAVSQAAVISDSTQDEGLFAACATPLMVQWHNARYRPAFRHVYLPGQYLDVVKRPGSGALKSVLVDDFPLWLLAGLPFTLASGWAVLGVALLFVSFWAVYETGYIENDQVAARFESDPQLSAAFHRFDASAIGPKPWIYAAFLGFLGVLCLRHSTWYGFESVFGIWASVLAGTRLYYRVYNYADKQTRAWLYLGLQTLRVGAFAAVMPINPVGTLACVARAASRWQIYLMYRKVRGPSGYDWTPLPERTIALALFGLLLLFGAIGGFVHLSSAGVCIAFLLWNGLLARRELGNIVSAAHLHQAHEPQAMPLGQVSSA